MLIVFFDIRGMIMVERFSCGQTVNQHYYKAVLIKSKECALTVHFQFNVF